MLEGLTPFSPMPLTIVTEQLVFRGCVRTRRRRVTDVLNEAEQAALVLTEATLTELLTDAPQGRDRVIQVSLDSILFAYADTPTESAREMRTAKKAIPAILHVPPFVIEGEIHLPLEADVRTALEEYHGRFLAVTNARYWMAREPDSVTAVDLVVVNHAKAHVSVDANVDWQPGAWELPQGGGGSNAGW